MRNIRPATAQDHDDLNFDKIPSALFVMEEDGQVIGGIGADWSDGKYVQVGPLFLLPGHEHKRWAILRLVEFVEAFLANAGVSAYLVSVAEHNPAFRRLVEHTGAQPYAFRDGHVWYQREVNTYDQRT